MRNLLRALIVVTCYLCETLLGFVPPETVGSRKHNQDILVEYFFQDLPHDATKIIIAQHARAHILTLIESLLMPDTLGGRVHLMYLLLLADLNNVSNFS